jgi:transcriptional regulator with XRE-family HTH domain
VSWVAAGSAAPCTSCATCSRNCRRDQRGLVSAALREVFNAEDRAQARDRATQVISRLEPIAPKVCRLLEDAEEDLIAFYAFPREHWTKLRSTNPLERVNKEIGRRSDVVGIFPNDPSAIRLVGALLIEQNDEWLVALRLVRYRAARDLSQRALAKLLEMEQPQVARLERGDVNPTLETLMRLAGALDIEFTIDVRPVNRRTRLVNKRAADDALVSYATDRAVALVAAS